jgi:Fe-S-cluster containining protein
MAHGLIYIPPRTVMAIEEKELRPALQRLYDQVPATRCAQSGECCSLTDQEFDEGYATMFPLYRAEYVNIVAYIEQHFSAEDAQRLLDFGEERPRRCPFLGSDNGCGIYPVRPLICRTYAVMNDRSIKQAATRNKDKVPSQWVDGFVRREGCMTCPRVSVTEPEKLERHADNLVGFVYERELVRLSQEVSLPQDDRLTFFRRLTRRRSLPVRWSWGGYNTVYRRPLAWLQERLAAYWKKAELAD